MSIREFREKDAPGVRACIVILQESERTMDPRMPPGEDMADAYLAYLVDECTEYAGKIFVAAEAGGIVGFACVLARYRSEAPDDGPQEYGLVSDLVVVPQARGRGLGRALLKRADAYARQAGVTWLRVGVLSANSYARQLYSAVGYRPWLQYMEKRIEHNAESTGQEGRWAQ